MSFIRNALVTVAAAASVFALATPAQAATGWDRCNPGYICLFDYDNGQGPMAWFQIGSPDLRQQDFDNRTQSVWNRTSSRFCLYVNYNYANDQGAGTSFSGIQYNTNEVNSYSSLKKC
ncbi:hypothetical protein GCM10022243_44700 [Saccharothrix violaceirubra]|uniref:Peptidase inhibitor family I36 n=1 Tax=Saccharothrix violaceirubra TaxID=413306 RepID=A0A7W7T147_9PSEU|nr:peptidase inhibitor family I36 protein [Saccharothrix violaceirubra]MBB4964641.1 hypothetical protein [Saccharothrix violaceirubra]